MKDLFRVVRWKNLLIVAGTMFLVRYALLDSLLSEMQIVLLNGGETNAGLHLPWYNFMILVFATVCLTAGGYVINDYFDIKTDLVNKGSVVVGTVIPRRRAMLLHNNLNIVGVAAGFYVSWSVGYFWFGTIFLLVSGLLWFYSASYKRQFLVGNLLVSLLTALVPFLVVVFEFPALYGYYSLNAISHPDYRLLFLWTGGFSLFAFLTTLAREIVKDIEDYEGDREYGRNTLPVVLGIRSSKIVVTVILLVISIALYMVWAFFINDRITFLYLTFLLVIPLLFIVYMIIMGKGKRQFHAASSMMKLVMLAGILYTLMVKLIITAGLY